MQTIHVTPTGFTCTCGASQGGALTGATAARMARQHEAYGHIDDMNIKIIDFRQLTKV